MNGTIDGSPNDRSPLLDPALLLRLGIGLTLLYAAIQAFANPTSWVGFIPHWLGAIIDPQLFLKIHSFFELVLGIALVAGFRVRWAAMLAALDMLALLVFYGVDDLTFRDMGLLMAALALFVLVRTRPRR